MSAEPNSRAPGAQAAKPVVCYVTDSSALRRPWLIHGSIRLALANGADWVQIREKHSPGRELLSHTTDAVGVGKFVVRTQVVLGSAPRIFVNDRLDVALATGASGVHLGGESMPVADTVNWCRSGHAPPNFAVGTSCHGLDDAHAAQDAGASYVFFGPVFDTPSKRTFGPPQGLKRLSEICTAVKIPVIAIGGINEENATSCIRAGAAGIAAIRLFQEASDEGALRNFIANLHTL